MPRQISCDVCNGVGSLADRHPHDPNARSIGCDKCSRGGLIPDPGCGSCYAGIVVMNTSEIQKCDDCGIFATDEDAINAVVEVLGALEDAYRQPEVLTVEAAIAFFKAVRKPATRSERLKMIREGTLKVSIPE